ncbi:MAG: class I SAM-dependent methyltransferase [Promethearchaeota archaeon]
MIKNVENSKLTFIGQLEKFLVNSLIGFQIINVFGIGRRLGIFDYLYEKGSAFSNGKKITSVSFNFNELSSNLNLSPHYLNGWIHMSLACGIFEVNNCHEINLQTAPFVYELLVDQNNRLYLGDFLALCYDMTPSQEILCDSFKTGKFIEMDRLGPEIREYGQKNTVQTAPFIDKLFSIHFEANKMNLKNQGNLLEVGCGYGNFLEYWAKKYKKAKIVGIDIDPRAVAFTKKKFSKWNDGIEILEITVRDFAHINKNKFDVIILNQVLHEINRDEKYRLKFFEDLYSILKDDGLLIVGEHIIPEIFSVDHKINLVEIWHLWLEVAYGSLFYNEEDFIKFIRSTPFKKVELIKESKEYKTTLESFQRGYFWALKK